MKIPEFYKLATNQWNPKHFARHYPEFYNWLEPQYPFAKSFQEKIYCYLHNIDKRPVCPTCGGELKFSSVRKGYIQYCSKKCSAQSLVTKEKIKNTNLKRYGVTNNLHIPEVEQKIKAHLIEKFGVDNSFKSKECMHKARKTCLEKYGVEWYAQTEASKERFKNTCLEKFGTEHPQQSNAIKEKTKNTFIEKYGYDALGSIPEIRKKITNTCQEKYGVDSYMQTQEFREKSKNTCRKKYGVDFVSQSAEIQAKISESKLRNYGDANYTNREKAKQTCLEKYSVEWPCMRQEARKFKSDSKPNKKFEKILETNKISYEREFSIHSKSYDFKIGQTLVEINPFATHNSTWGLYGKPINKEYHLEKTNLAKANGYKCIHVWDWDDANKIVDLLKEKTSIYARKCELHIVNKKELDSFLDDHHLQGTCKGQKIALGLYYEHELVQVMTFGKPRYNKNYEYELLRLCTKAGYAVIGGAQKLFKHFIDEYKPNSIISYCDNSKFTGTIYTNLGFTLLSKGTPSKHWYNGKIHITDNMLRKLGYDKIFNANYGKGTSNEQLMLEHKFVEIYDCGQSAYVYTKEPEK